MFASQALYFFDPKAGELRTNTKTGNKKQISGGEINMINKKKVAETRGGDNKKQRGGAKST